MPPWLWQWHLVYSLADHDRNQHSNLSPVSFRCLYRQIANVRRNTSEIRCNDVNTGIEFREGRAHVSQTAQDLLSVRSYRGTYSIFCRWINIDTLMRWNKRSNRCSGDNNASLRSVPSEMISGRLNC